jgi:hypothetical protein
MTCQWLLDNGEAPAEVVEAPQVGVTPTCVVPGCTRARGDPYYGASFFALIACLVCLIYSGGNRLCFF